jgi:hypothetical protein
VTPQPAPTPPAVPSPGPVTPGTAETGTGPREAGRLDRILAEQAKQDAELNDWATEELSSLPSFAIQPGSAVERLRAMVVALHAENVLLTEALFQVTHEYLPAENGWCQAMYRGDSTTQTGQISVCYRLKPGDPVHRTPTRVRAELETTV